MSSNELVKGKKWMGLPVVVIAIALLAVFSGGVVLASFFWHQVAVETTVGEPLSYEYDQNWVDGKWSPNILAGDSASAQITISNDASVDIPVSATVTGISDNVTIAVTSGGGALTVVPADSSIVVDVTATAALAAADGVYEYTVDFFRG